MTTAELTPAPARRFRGLPARVLIMCWLLVLMVVVLAAVCLVTRNLLRPHAEVKMIFERFTRGTGRGGGRGGAGLGLAIVRAIAEAHRGIVKVVSTPGHGATFGIELPAGGVRPCTGS